MGWTPTGNILQISLSENDIHQHLVWESSEKKQYLAAVFIPSDPINHFAAIDQNSVLQVYSLQTKEEAWRYKFPMECRTLIAHPKLPILHILTGIHIDHFSPRARVKRPLCTPNFFGIFYGSTVILKEIRQIF